MMIKEEHYECVPYAAPEGTSIDIAWKQWIRNWNNDWELLDRCGLALGFQSFTPIKIRPAAAPTEKLSKKRPEFFFVVDGLCTALRLTWEAGTQVIQLLQDEVNTLRRHRVQ